MRIVAMTNEAQLPMMKNMLNSALKSGWDMNLFHCYILDSQKEAANYGTAGFRSLTIRKLEVILDNLRQDSEIVWIDNDIVLFQNVLNDLRSKSGMFVMQDDIWSPCTGFFLARNTETSKRKLQLAIQWLSVHQGVNDQHAFQAVYRKIPMATVTLLDREEYPNGEIYFSQKKTSKAKMVHCNYLGTTVQKVERFKEYGLWDESDTAFDKVHKHII
jgi:hypothetical protein